MRTFSLLVYILLIAFLWVTSEINVITAAWVLLVVELFVTIFSYLLVTRRNLLSVFKKKDYF